MNKSLAIGAEILVVDDERASLEAFKLVLSKQGYRVRTASHGEAALQAVRESPPDLILLDVCMPGMDGYGVCERLKADDETRDIPVMFASALNDPHDRVRAFSAGGVDYVTKPMWVEEMLARLETHLTLRATQKQLEEKNAQLKREIAERKQAEEGHRQALAEALRATHALHQSQRTLTTLMGNLPGIAYRCRNDRDWTMEFINEGCLALTGYQPADLLHNDKLSYAQLIHPDDRETVWHATQTAVEAGEPFQLHYRITTASGEEKWVWEQGTGVPSEAGDVVLEGFITDVSERRQAEEKAQRLLEQQAAVNKLALAVGETRNLGSVYATIYEHIQAMMDAWGFIVSFYNDNTKLIEPGYAVHKGISVDVTEIPPVSLAEPGRGTQSQVIHSGEPLYVADCRQAVKTPKAEYLVAADGTVTEGPPGVEEEETTRSAFYAPMKIEGKPIGVMQLQSPHLDAYTQEDMDLLAAMANVAAVGIQNARLYDALQRELAERMQAEEALKEHSERLEEIVEKRTAELRRSEEKSRAQYRGIPVPTYTWQKVGKDIVLVNYNDAAEVITQGKIADFMGIELGEMYRDSPEIREDIARCLAEKTTTEREMRYRFLSTGEERNFAVKYAFVPPDLVLVHTEDITERVRAEEEAKKNTTKLRRLVNAMAGREVRMAELKDVIRQLRAQLEEARLEPVADDPLLKEGA